MDDPKKRLEAVIENFCADLGIDRQIFLKILDTALIDIVKDLENLRAAISFEDFKIIQEISHRIKGTSSNLRLNDVLLLSTELNEFSKQKIHPQKYASLSVQLEESVTDYQKALKETLSGL